jgi:hypothetical protein
VTSWHRPSAQRSALHCSHSSIHLMPPGTRKHLYADNAATSCQPLHAARQRQLAAHLTAQT